MYIPRDIEKQILHYLSFEHLTIEISGGRHVGKTTTILHFAKKHFQNVVYVDVRSKAGERFLRLVEELQEMPSSSYYLELLQQFAKTEQVKYTDDSHTIFIIDEIQESKKIYEMIREFTRSLNCKIVIAGSDFAKTSGYFQPVGSMGVLTMYPLSFLEFVQVWGGRDFIENQDLTRWDVAHDKWYLTAYRNYTIYGGYPIVVKNLISKNYQKAEERKKDLNRILKDAIQSANGAPSILDSIIALLVYKENAVIPVKSDIRRSITYLKKCGIIDYCDSYDFATSSTVRHGRFYFRDLGMLSGVLEESPNLDDKTKKRILAENFIFKTLNEQDDTPIFWACNSEELDFCVVKGEDDARRIRYGIKIADDQESIIVFQLNEDLTAKGTKITLPVWSSAVFQHFSSSSPCPEEMQDFI